MQSIEVDLDDLLYFIMCNTVNKGEVVVEWWTGQLN